MTVLYNANATVGVLTLANNKNYIDITDLATFETYLHIEATNWNGASIKVLRRPKHPLFTAVEYGNDVYTNNTGVDVFVSNILEYSFEVIGANIDGLKIGIFGKEVK